jgi:hypothetical protein
MDNDIVVTDPSFLKVLGKTLLKSAAVAAGLSVGFGLAAKGMEKVGKN